jgi:hypothetical protein
MAPTRKSRSVNKRFANDVSPEKDGVSSNKNKHRVYLDLIAFLFSKHETIGHSKLNTVLHPAWYHIAIIVSKSCGGSSWVFYLKE